MSTGQTAFDLLKAASDVCQGHDIKNVAVIISGSRRFLGALEYFNAVSLTRYNDQLGPPVLIVTSPGLVIFWNYDDSKAGQPETILITSHRLSDDGADPAYDFHRIKDRPPIASKTLQFDYIKMWED